MSTRLLPPVDLRRVACCSACGQRGRPLLRVWGYPTDDALRHEAEGRITLMGCLIPMEGEEVATHECRHCGADMWVPGR